ncbi:MAG: hypothetical protein HY646_06670 [Acidobacteria bacterium]|nr:hypothetical protein [Acidobacteriota bacterium]
MSLFVHVHWPVNDLMEYALAEPSENRWGAFIQHLEYVGILLEEPSNALNAIHRRVKELERDPPPNLKRINELKSKLKSSAIPAIDPARRGSTGPSAGAPIRVMDWEQSPLSLPPFHAVWTEVGDKALNELALGCRAYGVIDVIDPFVLSTGQEQALQNFAWFAEENGVTDFRGFGLWSPDGFINGVPTNLDKAKEQAARAFGQAKKIQWEFKLYAPPRQYRKRFHDRFVAFKSKVDLKAERVVAIGRGVEAFHENGDHSTILARVGNDWWDQAIHSYDESCPDQKRVLKFRNSFREGFLSRYKSNR